MSDAPRPSRPKPGPAAVRGVPRRLRADAERNRAALLDAAREVFAEQGLEAPLEEIALRAGVGIGTLYRRFPTRTQLVAAALVDKVAQYAEAAEQALSIPDPWAAFVTYVERICDLQADDRGLSDLLSMALPADEDIERLRRLANDRMAELIGRAKAAGRCARSSPARTCCSCWSPTPRWCTSPARMRRAPGGGS